MPFFVSTVIGCPQAFNPLRPCHWSSCQTSWFASPGARQSVECPQQLARQDIPPTHIAGRTLRRHLLQLASGDYNILVDRRGAVEMA